MTIKQAMAADWGDLYQPLGSAGAIAMAMGEPWNLISAWPLIPRDPADTKTWEFWKAVVKVMIAENVYGYPARNWLIEIADPTRVARIICVAWLAAEGRIEAI